MKHGEACGYIPEGREGRVMTEVLPLTLPVVLAGCGCDCAGQEKGGEMGEMHCNGIERVNVITEVKGRA